MISVGDAIWMRSKGIYAYNCVIASESLDADDEDGTSRCYSDEVCADPDETYRQSVLHYHSHRYNTAFKLAEKAAKAGVCQAMLLLAKMYERGEGCAYGNDQAMNNEVAAYWKLEALKAKKQKKPYAPDYYASVHKTIPVAHKNTPVLTSFIRSGGSASRDERLGNSRKSGKRTDKAGNADSNKSGQMTKKPNGKHLLGKPKVFDSAAVFIHGIKMSDKLPLRKTADLTVARTAMAVAATSNAASRKAIKSSLRMISIAS